MNKIFNILLLLITVTTISSCQSPNNKRHVIYQNYINENNLISIKSIQTFKFQGWSSLDYKHLIVSSSHNKLHLISLGNYCAELLSARAIYFDQSMSSRLSARFDYLLVPGQQPNKCQINKIHEINRDQKQELLKLRKSTL